MLTVKYEFECTFVKLEIINWLADSINAFVETNVANWLVGFFVAIVMMLCSELYKEKRNEKKEKLRFFREVKFFLRRYRDKFETIQDDIDNQLVLNDWRENLRSFSEQIQQRTTKLYFEWELLNDLLFDQLLDFSKDLHKYSLTVNLAITRFSNPPEYEGYMSFKEELVEIGDKLHERSLNLDDGIVKEEIKLKNKKLRKLIPY